MFGHIWEMGSLHDPVTLGQAIKASNTLEHQTMVWKVPYACAKPYHPGSGKHKEAPGNLA